MSVAQISLELGKAPKVIQNRIRALGSKVELLSGRFIDPGSRSPSVMYDPQIVPLIRAFGHDRLVEAGWMYADKVADSLRADRWIVKGLLEKLVQERPHLGFKREKNDRGHHFTLYNPAVVDELRDDPKLANRDWKRASLALILDGGVVLPTIVIRDTLKKMQEQLPGEVYDGRWSPRFIDSVKQSLRADYLGSYLTPDNKVTVKSLADYLQIPAGDIIQARQKIVPPNSPPWIESKEIEPKNVEAVIKTLCPNLQQPPAWEPLIKHCKRRDVVVPPAIGSAYPKEWVQDFIMPGTALKSTYYHPLLVKLINKVNQLRSEEKQSQNIDV
jgi:hypothetical protein